VRRAVGDLLVAAGIGLAAATSAPAAAPAVPSGAAALTGLDPRTGERVPLDPSAGPMHVVFLATWCRPCVAELPRLADLEDRWKADG